MTLDAFDAAVARAHQEAEAAEAVAVSARRRADDALGKAAAAGADVRLGRSKPRNLDAIRAEANDLVAFAAERERIAAQLRAELQALRDREADVVAQVKATRARDLTSRYSPALARFRAAVREAHEANLAVIALDDTIRAEFPDIVDHAARCPINRFVPGFQSGYGSERLRTALEIALGRDR